MRIRLIKQTTGDVDGVPLDKFFVGSVYDVGTSLANYLLAIGAAEPAPENAPALVLPIDHPIAERMGHRDISKAADSSRSRARKPE